MIQTRQGISQWGFSLTICVSTKKHFTVCCSSRQHLVQPANPTDGCDKRLKFSLRMVALPVCSSSTPDYLVLKMVRRRFFLDTAIIFVDLREEILRESDWSRKDYKFPWYSESSGCILSFDIAKLDSFFLIMQECGLRMTYEREEVRSENMCDSCLGPAAKPWYTVCLTKESNGMEWEILFPWMLLLLRLCAHRDVEKIVVAFIQHLKSNTHWRV